MTQMQTQLRWMIRRDMPDVLEIEKQCFTSPWPEQEFVNTLKLRNCIGMVAEKNEAVVGFMIYVLEREHLQLINFAVHPVMWRKGIGSELMEKLKFKVGQQRRTSIIDEVRETNLKMQQFLRHHGFVATGVLRQAFEDTGEDAYRMKFSLVQEAAVFVPRNRIAGLLD